MDDTQPQATKPPWRPLSAIDRRVAGVLVEKAKTTPSAYPLTLNALRTGCNQKSNRDPLMHLEDEAIGESLERLRGLGAVTEVQGDGRVPKYRHMLYEWLGVGKVELAVMAELLLRGAQTVGELRGRSARMDPIPDVAALRPVLQSLQDRGLVQFLTPEGRGCVVSHTLYQADEMDKVRKRAGAGASPADDLPAASTATAEPSQTAAASVATSSAPSPDHATAAALEDLRRDVQTLRAETSELREHLTQLYDQLRVDLDNVKQQLGI